MTKRDFFIISLKIIGIYFLIDSIIYLPQSISYLLDIGNFSTIYLPIIITVLSEILLIGLYLGLIFNAPTIVDFLKLSKGFQEDYIYLEKLNVAGIAKVSLAILGLAIFINTLPEFIRMLLYSYKSVNMNMTDDIDSFNWILIGLKLVLAFFLFTNYQFIIKLAKLDEGYEEEGSEQSQNSTEE